MAVVEVVLTVVEVVEEEVVVEEVVVEEVFINETHLHSAILSVDLVQHLIQELS